MEIDSELIDRFRRHFVEEFQERDRTFIEKPRVEGDLFVFKCGKRTWQIRSVDKENWFFLYLGGKPAMEGHPGFDVYSYLPGKLAQLAKELIDLFSKIEREKLLCTTGIWPDRQGGSVYDLDSIDLP